MNMRTFVEDYNDMVEQIEDVSCVCEFMCCVCLYESMCRCECACVGCGSYRNIAFD